MLHTKATLKAAAIGSVIFLSGSLGCKEDAVVNDKPAGAVMGMAGSAGFAGAMTAGTGGMTAGVGGTTAGAGGMTAGAGGMIAGASGAMGGVSGGTGGDGGAMGGIGGMSGGMGGDGGAIGGIGGMSGGMGGDGGAMGGMSGGIGGEGGGDDGPPGPCPTGWECSDTSALGATDKDGNLIIGTSCGKGALIECDDANPAASCPELSKPFCAHVFGVTSCSQLCTP